MMDNSFETGFFSLYFTGLYFPVSPGTLNFQLVQIVWNFCLVWIDFWITCSRMGLCPKGIYIYIQYIYIYITYIYIKIWDDMGMGQNLVPLLFTSK